MALSSAFRSPRKDLFCWILDIVRSDGFVLINVIGNYGNINPCKELNILNELFKKYEIENYDFQ